MNATFEVEQPTTSVLHSDGGQQEFEDVELHRNSLASRISFESNFRKATVVSCFINLANTIVGSGMLGLPYAYSHTGWVLGSILLVICGISSAFALHLLALCALKQEGPASFYSVAQSAMPMFTVVIDVAVAIKCFGVATSYLIVIGDLMPEVMQQFGTTSTLQDRHLWVFIGFCIVAPLCCLRNLDSLKFTSMASLAFVVFLTILVILYAADISSLDACADTDDGDSCTGSTSNALIDIDTGRVFSIFVFGFTCQQNVFAVTNEISHPTPSRINLVITTAISVAFIIYMIVAACGYKTYGSEVEPDILVNYPETSLTSTARLAVSLLVAFSYPLQCHPSRRSILTLISMYADGDVDVGKQPQGNGGINKDGTSNNGNTNPIAEPVSGHYASPELNKEANYLDPSDYNDPQHTRATNTSSLTLSQSTFGAAQDTSNNTPEEVASLPDVPLATQRLRYIIVTVCFLGLSLLIGLTVTNLGTVLALVGATGSTTVSYILPGFFYYIIFKDEGPAWKRNLALLQGIAGLIIVPVCLTFIFL